MVNGQKAFRFETSKALQLSLLESLGLPYPKSRVINSPADAIAAAEGLRFPIVIKPNIGGSGAGVTKFNTLDDLKAAVESKQRRHRSWSRQHRPGAGIHPCP